MIKIIKLNDPIKRINIVHEIVKKKPETLSSIKICGSENPGFGNYLGIVKDNELNILSL